MLERGPRDGDVTADKVLDRLADFAAWDGRGTAEERMLRRVAYGVVGPIFLGFAQWLVERVRSEPADLVLFCARDGYFVHQAYARFARHVPLPPARYFEVSRRAVPSMRKIWCSSTLAGGARCSKPSLWYSPRLERPRVRRASGV
jgi:hypothetical protein